MIRRHTLLLRLAAIITIAAVVVAWVGLRVSNPLVPPDESPTDRVHRLCTACGLEPDEVDRLIVIMRESPEDRGTLTRLWEETYDDPEALENARKLCGECVDAILDAAGSLGPSTDSTTQEGLGGPGS